MTTSIARWAVPVCALAAPLLSGGCGGSAPRPPDAGQARGALVQALDAWQKGEKPDAALALKPPVRVIDREWEAGARLLRYEVGADSLLGAEVRFDVVLTVEPPGRKAAQKRAVYGVGTSPAITVVREDDN